MKSFEYTAPTTVQEAIGVLNSGRQARPYAGGTDLLVQLRRGARALDLVVDIKRIPELTALQIDPQSGLRFGAAVSCARLSADPQVRALYPGLVDGASIIGGSAIQERATVGGNLCNAAPSADSIPPLLVLDAQVEVAGLYGSRVIPVAGFCTAPGRTLLEPGELLVALLLPAPQRGTGAAYLRMTPRHEMDIAVAGAAAAVTLDKDGITVTGARIALSAVAPVPLTAIEAASSLIDKPAGEGAWDTAAALAVEAARPISDVRGSMPQRKHLVGVLVKRALRIATQRAQASLAGGEYAR